MTFNAAEPMGPCDDCRFDQVVFVVSECFWFGCQKSRQMCDCDNRCCIERCVVNCCMDGDHE